MIDNRKVKIEKTRQVNTYETIWRVSYWTLDQAKKEVGGSFYQITASLVFTAFTLEAYLNHIGKIVFECWDDLDRLSPNAKINVIAEKLKVNNDNSKRPFQTIRILFDFRNDIAHGKTITLSDTKVFQITDKKHEIYMHESLEPKWVRYCTIDNAEQARVDVEKIMKLFNDSAGMKDYLGISLGASSLASILPE
jgi:hypothetical protein